MLSWIPRFEHVRIEIDVNAKVKIGSYTHTGGKVDETVPIAIEMLFAVMNT